MDLNKLMESDIEVGSREFMMLAGEGRHPSTVQILRHFAYSHLPEPWRTNSQACADLALCLVARVDDSPELVVGLRKLLEAKDAFVRATIDMQPSKA